jgi:Carboxypeptidase regulatory-like domain
VKSVKLTRGIFVAALLLLFHRGAAAQPGGDPSSFSALETCNEAYLKREYVFVGRVVSLEEMPNGYGGGGVAWKATVAVETSLKGQAGEVVELVLSNFPPTGDRQLKGKKFIFTATRVAGRGFGGLYSDKRSTPLDDLPPGMLADVLDGIRDTLWGVPQPRVVGTVREQSWGISFDPEAGRPLADVVVVAEGKDGRRFETRTDGDGHFRFDELPAGMYTLRPLLPKKMVLYDAGFTRVEGGKKYLEVDEGLCGRAVRFVAQEAGEIVGSIRREKGDWAFGTPLMYLYRRDPESNKIDFAAASLVPSDVSLSEADAENLIRFSFKNVPAGSYVLSIGNIDPSGRPETIYYPGVSAVEDADFIDVSADRTTEVVVKLPPLQQRRIFGLTRLPDGTPVNATVLFINLRGTSPSDAPVESLSAYDFAGSFRTTARDGRFEFRYWGGRRLRIFAYFDGARDGARVRFFGQTRSLLVDADVGPITITLDRSEPLK